MQNPLDRWRQRQARQRYMPRAPRSGSGRTARVAGVALLVILATAALLELRRGGGSELDLVQLAQEQGRNPLDMVEDAARSRRLIFVSDVPAAAAPKRFAEQAIERIALSSGLDLVVLDVDENEQPYIDRYLATVPEDPSILLSRPRAVREGDAASRAFLDIYRTVWRVNQQLGPARRIRIVAADAPGWPPSRATSPADAARLYAERADHMAENVNERALARNPGARILFLVDGLHALKSGGGRVMAGGAAPAEFMWLAARMRERFPSDVYSILVDAAPAGSLSANVVAYRGTAFGDVLRRGGIPARTALPVTETFDNVARTPIRTVSMTGIDFYMEPRAAAMTTLADAYVYFGS